MTTLLYLIAAAAAAALATRAWMADRTEPTRQAFLGLGWCVAVAYVAFALSLLPRLEALRALYVLAGATVPAFTLWCVDRMFAARETRPSPWVSRAFLVTVLVVPVAVALHLVLYRDLPRASPVEVGVALVAYALFGVALLRLWRVHEEAEFRVDRIRLRYLLGFAAGAVVFTLFEQLARNLAAPVTADGLPLATRGVVLQGAIPPVSVLFALAALYFLYHTLVMSRLLDLHELFSRLITLAVCAALLVVVDGVAVVWFGAFAEHPVHSTFQIFLASLLFLAAYDPIRAQVSWWSNRLFNQRGQQLAEVLDKLRHRLPTVISTGALTEMLLSRLHASGRVPVCSVYLWDEKLDAFSCVGHRGFGEEPPLAAVAAHPFTDFLVDGEPWYMRPNVARGAREDDRWREVLALMDAMRSDLVLPFVSRGMVLGWLQLRDEDWSDGFSGEEIVRLAAIAELASIVLANIHDFQALEEEHRLAALGAMAAGLAHEIRNPLAGIKGAAQFLQGERMPEEAQDMLQVVIDETDRLNIVVSQFLDYARPFELTLAPDHVNALATHVLAVLRAQGIPKAVRLVEHLAGDLPSVPLDRVRLSQVLLNLLQNALQAMPEGGTLTVATRRRTSRSGMPVLEIAVSDTGAGLPADVQQKLFIPFFTTKPDGTGLGLAISQRIVQAHGGEIDVLSTPGGGATFVVRLPLPRALEMEDGRDAAK